MFHVRPLLLSHVMGLLTFGPSLVEGGVGPCDGPWSSGSSHEEGFVKLSGGKARPMGKSLHQHLQMGDTEGLTVDGMLVGEGQRGVSSLATLKALCGPLAEVYKGSLVGFGKDKPFCRIDQES